MASPNLLFISHPGHELFAFGWLAQTGASLCVVTDGSGHENLPRVDETLGVIALAKAKRGPIWGRIADGDLYQLVLEKNHDVLLQLTLELADFLVENRVERLVCDALEFQILAHDLAYAISETAVEIAGSRGQAVDFYQLPIYHMDTEAFGENCLQTNLSEAQLDEKMASTECYKSPVLRGEIAHFIELRGKDTFRLETLLPADRGREKFERMDKPQWERHGEAMQESGRYEHVIRFGEHFLPILNRLWALLDEAHQSTSQG